MVEKNGCYACLETYVFQKMMQLVWLIWLMDWEEYPLKLKVRLRLKLVETIGLNLELVD